MKTSLYTKHVESQAVMVNFYGWKMPMHYGSQLVEHQAVRNSAGMFDVSHMMVTDFVLTDTTPEHQSNLDTYLRTLLTYDILKLEENNAYFQAKYCLVLNNDGGILDDVIVYKTATGYRIVSNCGTRDVLSEWFLKHQTKEQSKSFQITSSKDLSIIAVQGPQFLQPLLKALQATKLCSTPQTINALQPFTACWLTSTCMVSATGYTGEPGVEIILPGDQAQDIWDQLRAAGVQPAGLGARDTLRLESGMMLYGQDMDALFTPFESRLKWTLDTSDPSRQFNGLEALNNHSPRYNFFSFVLEHPNIPRAQAKIYQKDAHEPCGQVTSGTFSPSLKHGIGFARINKETTGPFEIEIRKKRCSLQLVKGAFIRKGHPAFEKITG